MRQELLDKRPSEIRGMFGRIAGRYDLLNRVLSLGQDRRWRRRLARRVATAAPERLLDVCTGTGDIALALPAGPEVVGADFSLPMLARARSKAAAHSRRVLLIAADAAALPLADESMDLVTVAFGVRNFADLAGGLGELVRVLRPGGTLLILEFSHPRGFAAPVLAWWVRAVPPRIGRALSGDPEAYDYLPASVGSFADRDVMCALLRRLGLDAVSATALTGGVCTLYEGTRDHRRRRQS